MDKPVHTPGPWEIVKAEYLSHDAPDGQEMLSSGGIMGGTPDEPSWVIEGEVEWAPDASLIAAAPDMLDALKDVMSSLETLGIDGWSDAPHLMNVTRAAIAKATA